MTFDDLSHQQLTKDLKSEMESLKKHGNIN